MTKKLSIHKGEVTEALERCRYDAAVEIPESFNGLPAGEIGRLEFPPMQVARIELRDDIALAQRGSGLDLRRVAAFERLRAGRAALFRGLARSALCAWHGTL